jgi:hypothetical protein
MLVHRYSDCARAGFEDKVAVSRNTVMVHRKRMPACPECWPEPREFDATVVRSDLTYSGARPS